MKERRLTALCRRLLLVAAALVLVLALLGERLPAEVGRGVLVVLAVGMVGLAYGWSAWQNQHLARFSDDICRTVDALMEEREPEHLQPYEETATSKVQGKLLHYYEKMMDARRESEEAKATIQALVSDISHQVKTPVANIQLYGSILRAHELPREKQLEFLDLMAAQTEKLDFLMQSLVKMSRLETGTFDLHVQDAPLAETIAQAMSTVWNKAEAKAIGIAVTCEPQLLVRHDPKWTAEALANILDNAVKYTPPGGSITITVRPWQFYTRIDIADTGIGIDEAHYHDVFRRFYRGEDVAAEEGVGLGLYLARGIITRQNGYITVKSEKGQGSMFSIFLLS